MAVTLTITDAGNGTGGSASVAGAGGGDTVNVYYATWKGSMGGLAWTLGGSRSGSGVVALALAVGYYAFMAFDASTGEFSGLVYQNFTDGSISVHERILDAVKVRHDGLGFSYLPTAKVLKRWFPKIWEVVAPPAVAIAPVGTEEYNDQVMARDDVGYPVMVALIDSSQGDLTANMTRALLWRNVTSKALRNQRLPGVTNPEVFISKLRPMDIAVKEAFDKGYIVSLLLFQFFVRETRG